MIWSLLPDDILYKVKQYIIVQEMSIISKYYYENYYDIYDKMLLRRLLLNTIRNDHYYVFQHFFFKYYDKIKIPSRYRYQGKTYKTIADFLKYRIIEQQAMRCKNVIFKKITNEYKWM